MANAALTMSMKFIANTRAFNLPNAYYLARLAEIVYEPFDNISAILPNEFGLDRFKPFEEKKTDTQAFVASNKDIIVLVFRGTTQWADWMTNFKIALTPSGAGNVHSGFNRALESVWGDVYDTVMSWKERPQTFWITGHSLGGALATLAADRFTEENVEIINSVYTLGQPRVGDNLFAQNFDRKMKKYFYRLVDDEDIVTRIPVPPGYRHVGTEYFFDNKGVLFNSNTFWQWWRSVSESVAIRSSQDVENYRLKNPGGIRDHSPAYYIKYLGRNLQEKGKNAFSDYLRGL